MRSYGGDQEGFGSCERAQQRSFLPHHRGVDRAHQMRRNAPAAMLARPAPPQSGEANGAGRYRSIWSASGRPFDSRGLTRRPIQLGPARTSPVHSGPVRSGLVRSGSAGPGGPGRPSIPVRSAARPQNRSLARGQGNSCWEKQGVNQIAAKPLSNRCASPVTTQIVCESRGHSPFRRQSTQQQKQRAGSPRFKILYPKHTVQHRPWSNRGQTVVKSMRAFRGFDLNVCSDSTPATGSCSCPTAAPRVYRSRLSTGSTRTQASSQWARRCGRARQT
jgi:hypothetical protein